MFVELIETLRCPHRHEESQLIASALRTEARHIVEGVLGCSICGAKFPIADGIARFGEPQPTPAETPSPEAAMRLAAFLELTDARGFALLCGRWGAHVDLLLRLTETRIVLVNPPSQVPPDIAAGVVLTRDAIPFAAGAARAVALDDGSGDLVRSAVRAVRTGGRVLGPATLPLPYGVTELARDERMWVGEKNTASDSTPRLVEIRKAAR